jgi:hypothetical protein
MKLGWNASDVCALLFNTYEGGAMKKPSVFEWHKQYKDSSQVNTTNKDNAHHLLQYQEY